MASFLWSLYSGGLGEKKVTDRQSVRRRRRREKRTKRKNEVRDAHTLCSQPLSVGVILLSADGEDLRITNERLKSMICESRNSKNVFLLPKGLQCHVFTYINGYKKNL